MSVRSFMDEYRAGTLLRDDGRRFHGGVLFTLASHRTWVTLCRIEALEAGHGDGGRALDWLCGLADKHSVILSGCAEPFNSQFLNLERLLGFYERRGFVVTQAGDDPPYIDRLPR